MVWRVFLHMVGRVFLPMVWRVFLPMVWRVFLQQPLYLIIGSVSPLPFVIKMRNLAPMLCE